MNYRKYNFVSNRKAHNILLCTTGIETADIIWQKPNDLLDHVDHMAEIAGPEKICVGIDYFEYQAGVADDDAAKQIIDKIGMRVSTIPDNMVSQHFRIPTYH